MKRFVLLITLLLLFGAGLSDKAHAGAPVAENLELETRRGVPLHGALTARDPEGDAVGYLISTWPRKGTLQLGEDGRFVYLPRERKSGRDYFGYRAVDAEGNVSQEATAIIRIES